MNCHGYIKLITRNNNIHRPVFIILWSSTGQNRRNLELKIVSFGAGAPKSTQLLTNESRIWTKMSSYWYTSLIRRNNHIIPTVFLFNIWSSTGQKRRNLGRKIVTLGLILQISLKSLQKNATYLIKQVVEWVYKYDWTKVWLFYIIFDSSSEENRRKSEKR